MTLGKDATYIYNDVPGTGAGNSGYYTINENNIILHAIIINSNDPSVTIPNKTKTITLKINDDKSITDNDVNGVGLETILKKSSTGNTENIDISSVLTEKHKLNAVFFEADR